MSYPTGFYSVTGTQLVVLNWIEELKAKVGSK
jgi:hypothetical protein